MDDTLQKALRKATQNARQLLEDEFEEQLDGRFDIRPDGTIPDDPGPHLDAEERLLREKLVTAIGHREAGGMGAEEAVATFLREAAFTTLNRFVALKMLEERGVVKESISEGQQSSGFKEFTMLAPGLSELSDGGYRLYLESLFDEIGQEVKVLFDRDVVAGRLWPRRPALEDLLEILNKDALADAWQETEAIGWVYQYFNADSEREEMREESSTPRNSHELAVRNQFFTPHYVVQFLTDNTLGRTWHEMHKGDTRIPEECDYFAERADEVFLDEGEVPPEPSNDSSNALSSADENGESGVTTEASHEEDDKGPTYVPYRAKKDPRELKILDPACGSGHFLLYAFDLLWTIYEEAWEDPEAPVFEETGCTLSEDYESLDDLHSALPGLILEKNLYGVDIDPRATQIASFALWMRAQEAYSEIELSRGERPPITKTNVVVAEPMPGDEELREEFIESLQPPALGQLVDVVFDKMELADEAGMLLRIEEEIRDAIKEAKEQWEQPRQLELLPEETRQEFRQAGLFDVSNISDEEFWSSVEDQIYRALEDYAEKGERSDDLRRQLFMNDATAGFAFVDLCRQQYDAVLMNPPFGESSESTKKYLNNEYLDTKNDILQAFVERSNELLRPGGYLGAITSRTSFFVSSAKSWRERIVLRHFRPRLLADFGVGVLDAMVETAAYVMRTLNDQEDRKLTLELIPDLERVETNSKGKFSVPKFLRAREHDYGHIESEKQRRRQAEIEIERLKREGLISDVSGRYPQFRHNYENINQMNEEENLSSPRPKLQCWRLLDDEDKEKALLQSIQKGDDQRQFEADTKSFRNVPGSPFAYWISDRVRELYEELPSFQNEGRSAQHGLSTKDDDRYLRCWWEVPSEEVCPPSVHPDQWESRYCVRGYRWFPFAKGGEYAQYYSTPHLVVNWHNEGREIESDVLNKYSYLEGNAEWVLHRECDYYRPGLTWTVATTSRFNIRILPKGCLFSDIGQAAFPGSKPNQILCYSALMNSDPFIGYIMISMGLADEGRKKYDVGVIRDVPIPKLGKDLKKELKGKAKRIVRKKKKLTSNKETSKEFVYPEILDENGSNLEDIIRSWEKKISEIEEEVKKLHRESVGLSYKAYGLNKKDREGFNISLYGFGADRGDKGDISISKTRKELVINLISYVVGVMFGRWDIQLGIGERAIEKLSVLQDALPVTPPGMLSDGKDSSGSNFLEDYPVSIPQDGILVDDVGHSKDLVGRSREVLNMSFEEPHDIESSACEILGESDLRSFFRKTTGFFREHRKQYSKSRRKAPIYWQLAPQSTDYSVWLYYPKLTQDTFYRVLDLLKEKIRHQERQLSDLRQEVGDTPSSTQRREIADQDDFVSELRGFRKEVERVAPLWNPNMNDGVVINFAPLWRLVQHNRSWQKECKKHWDRLVDGEYDWSHWAMHLWPERVVPKCAERRDLAIAHDLEDVFWEQDAEGDWTARNEPTRPVGELVEERTSRTVKSALEDLLNAPPPR